jgi:hypothetical protein
MKPGRRCQAKRNQQHEYHNSWEYSGAGSFDGSFLRSP